MDPIARFAELVQRPAEEVDLASAALAIAAAADPGLEPQRWLEELDRLAAGVDDREGLVHRLFVERGFAGNTDDYYHPDNSLLHRVLARRLGIPITLAVVMIEVGRRAGVLLEGVGMPGHFLVRDPSDGALLDAFHGGTVLDEDAVEARFRAATGAHPAVAFGPRLLPAVNTYDILERMLANLRAVYATRGADHPSASLRPTGHTDVEWLLRMRLALPTAGPQAVLELASALSSRGRYREAAQEIETRAEAYPDDRDRLLATARSSRAHLN